MLCVACLKSHKWGLFPPRSEPYIDIIWMKVNLFDILDEIHNLPSTLQLSKFVCPLRSPPPQTGPAFSASCSEDPATTQVWSYVLNKSYILFGFFDVANIFGQNILNIFGRQHLDKQSRIDRAADPAAAASTATAATSRSATTTSPAARRTSEQSLPSSRAGSSCRRRGRSSWRWSTRPAAALGPAADVAARGAAGEE